MIELQISTNLLKLYHFNTYHLTAENEIGSTEITFALREVSNRGRTYVSANTSSIQRGQLWHLWVNQGESLIFLAMSDNEIGITC